MLECIGAFSPLPRLASRLGRDATAASAHIGARAESVVMTQANDDQARLRLRLGPAAMSDPGKVVAVSRSASHTMGKPNQLFVRLVAGLGIEGDAHAGATVKHRSRVERDASQPNLRQVHLIHGELHDELRQRGFEVGPGDMGENVTTRGIDLLGLPLGTRLHLGPEAVVEVTGLRTPCGQLNGVQEGLQAAVLDRDAEGQLVRKAGVMSVVLAGGDVSPDDVITVELPPEPHYRLEPV
jgi:hypothetical protein